MYRKAISLDRMNPEAYYRLGLLEERAGVPGTAIGEFRRAVDLQGSLLDARKHLAEIYFAAYAASLKNPLASESQQKRLRQSLEEEVEFFRKRAPGSFEALRLEGHLLFADGKRKEAILKLQAANQIKPLEPDVVLALVQALSLDDRFPEAEKIGRDLVQKEKGYSPIYLLLYGQYMSRNRPQDAEEILKMQAANNPKNDLAVIQLAAHYFAQKQRPAMVKTLKQVLSNPKDFPDARLNVGDFYLRIGEWDEAQRCYEEGLRANRKRKPVYQKRLVELLVRQGRKSDALRLAGQILRENPKDSEARSIRASLLVDTGGTKELLAAIAELESLVLRPGDSPNPVLHFDLGRAYWARGDSAKAEDQFREAAKIRSDYLLPRLYLAYLLLLKGDFDGADKAANEILQFDRGNVPARLLRARALAGLGRLEESHADLREVQKVDPDSADVVFQAGALQLIERHFKEAEETFRRLYQKSDYRGLGGLMEVYAAQKQYDRAIQWLQEELAKAPANAALRNSLAKMAVAGGKYDLAIATFKILIEQGPPSEDSYLRLGETYRLANNLERAAECFRRASKLAPSDPTAQLQVATTLEALGRRYEARDIYEKVLKLDPENLQALNNLAYVLADTGGNLDRALSLAQRAKQRMPQNFTVSDTLGWIYIKKNLNDSALGLFRDLVAKAPGKSTYRYHYAIALLQNGDKLAAKKELEAALQNKPSKEEEARIKELINKIG